MRVFLFAMILAGAGTICGHADETTPPPAPPSSVTLPITAPPPAPSLPAVTPTPPAPDAPPPGPPQPTVLQTFKGTGSFTSPVFQVQNKWEVRWRSPKILTITVCSANHNIVAGNVGVSVGSFFLGAGGTYYLQIDGQSPPAQSQDPDKSTTTTTTTDSGDSTNSEAVSTLPDPLYAWTVDVVGIPPNGNTAQIPKKRKGPLKLTDDQARSIVQITGDNTSGTGFLIKTADGPFVVTDFHVIANNPNLKITTSTNAPITIVSSKGAADRTLALLSIQDAGYTYLDFSTNISNSVQVGDDVIISSNSGSGSDIATTNINGKVTDIGPERIEFDGPVRPANLGGPIFHPKSNTVLGVVTESLKIDTSGDLDKSSFASRNTANPNAMHYYGVRFDTVTRWVPFDMQRFQNETSFLDQFHEKSRHLDSYLNGGKGKWRDDEEGGRDDVKSYLKDDSIVKATTLFYQLVPKADGAQRLQALKGLLFDLETIADTNVDAFQDMNNFYPFNQARAKEELGYRKALKAELDAIGLNVERLVTLPRPVE